MSKLKTIFYQTVLISAAILLGVGVQTVILHFTTGFEKMDWYWYTPISMVLSALFCSLPTMLLFNLDALERKAIWTRIVLHFIFVGAIVGVCGFFFNWYHTVMGYLPILIMYTLIYAVVWVATGWMAKNDEKKINEVIKEYQDPE